MMTLTIQILSIIRYGFITAIISLILMRIIEYIQQFSKKRKAFNKFSNIPIKFSKIWIGNLDLVFADGFDTENAIIKYFNLLKEYTKLFNHHVFTVWLSIKPIIVINNAKYAEKVLSSTSTFLEKNDFYDMVKPWLNEGLLTSPTDKWRKRRKMLTPAFHFNILEQFMPIMNDQANVLLNIIENRQANAGNNPIDIVPLITNAALDVIAETAMGIKIGSQTGNNREYVENVTRVTAFAFKRMMLPWLQLNFIYFNFLAEGRKHRQDIKSLHQFTMNIIKDRKNDIITRKNLSSNDEKMNKRLAFMDLLIEQHLKNPADFTESDIREEVDTFMFAGHDTTAMSVVWTLHLLGNHPEIQNRVHNEIDEILSESGYGNIDNDGNINWNQNQLRKMKFLEACIKESLRLYPSVPIFARCANQDVESEPNLIIPKNATILIFLYAIQRDANYFKNPECYIPDRFVEDSDHYVGHINPFAFVPFSAGPRNCIGQKFALQEEKILLATILSKFQIKSGENFGEVDILPALIFRPKSSVNILFTPR